MPLHGFLFGRRQHFGVSPVGRPRSREVIQVMISVSFFTFSRNCGAAGSTCCSFSQCLMSITHTYPPHSQSVAEILHSSSLVQNLFPPFRQPVFLLTACWLVRYSHFDESGIKQRPEYLVPELSPVGAPNQVHQYTYSLFRSAIFQDFNLVPIWSRHSADWCRLWGRPCLRRLQKPFPVSV